MNQTPRWGIVATVSEPTVLVQAFVAHHLWLGADEIHLYFDDPKDTTPQTLAHLPNVFCTLCDKPYWRALISHRPRRHNNRQSLNATHGQSVCKVDYLLSCDADEFLAPGADVVGQLVEIPDYAPWMKVFNVERAMVRGARPASIFDGVFKIHYQGAQAPTALPTGEMIPFGFTGHAAGKPFVQVSAGMTIGIHTPRYGHIKDRKVPAHYPADQIELLHFDGLTPLHWAAKFLRQAAHTPERLDILPENRRAQWAEIKRVLDDPEGLSRLYDQVNGFDLAQIETLEEDGYIMRSRFDPREALAKTFPGQSIDLSPQGFDAALRPRIRRWLRKARNKGVEI